MIYHLAQMASKLTIDPVLQANFKLMKDQQDLKIFRLMIDREDQPLLNFHILATNLMFKWA